MEVLFIIPARGGSKGIRDKNIYPLKGILYSMVRVYEEDGEREKALEIVKDWVLQFPDDEEINQLHNYLLQINSVQ